MSYKVIIQYILSGKSYGVSAAAGGVPAVHTVSTETMLGLQCGRLHGSLS